jgi:hypothetical protein
VLRAPFDHGQHPANADDVFEKPHDVEEVAPAVSAVENKATTADYNEEIVNDHTDVDSVQPQAVHNIPIQEE